MVVVVADEEEERKREKKIKLFSLTQEKSKIKNQQFLISVAVVGTAGAIVGGWGNLGGGLTHIAMVREKREKFFFFFFFFFCLLDACRTPFLCLLLLFLLSFSRSLLLSLSLSQLSSRKLSQLNAITPQPLFDKALIARGYSPNVAWRLSFYLPGAMHIFAGLLVFFFGQDMPDGSKLAVRKADAAAGKGITARTDVGWPSWRAAILNYRTWVLTLIYAVTFGVEISVDNVLSRYFQTQFKL